MSFDIELFLVIGSLLTGLVWLLDILWLRKLRTAKVKEGDNSDGYPEPWYVEYSKSFFPVLFIVLILRSFVAEPFRIPSGSMMPTLLVGDFILVNKFSYGLRLPVLHTELTGSDGPDRGDVVVFRYPRNPSVDYIKRVVGLPGDHVAYFNKQLFINGQPAKQFGEEKYSDFDPERAKPGQMLLEENLTGIEHNILIDEHRLSVEGEYIIPPHSYFVMGDNRDNSNDSRYWGVVPEENLVGKAFMVWMNWDFADGTMDVSRIGNKIN
jgi:signal peptidase I